MSTKNSILITGATGFVGSWLCEYILTKKNIEVHGLKRWRSPMENIDHIKDKIRFEDCDITDGLSVFRVIDRLRPDKIFHLAAQSYVVSSFNNPIQTLTTNVSGTANILESIRQLKEKDNYNPKIIVVTSSEVYGQVAKKDIPITEECQFRPQSPYGVSKAAEDLLAYQYFCSYGLRTVRARTFTHEGARRGEVFFGSAFAKQIAQIEIGLQKPVINVGNLNSIRTMADVRDAVNAYWLMSEKCPAGEVYNIGGDVSMEVGDYLHKLIELSNLKKPEVKIKVDKNLLRPSDVTLQIPSSKKFRKVTGWQPKYSYVETLQSMLDYWRRKINKSKDLFSK